MMTWDKTITAGGHTATPAQLQKAWEGWVEQGGGRGHALTRWLEMRAPDGAKALPRYHRITDRMLQKARKAGAICFEKGVWRIVEKGEPS